MKKFLILILVLTCFILAMSSCTADPSDPDAGTLSTVTLPEPLDSKKEDPQKVPQNPEQETDNNGNVLKNGGNNSETGWGKLHPLN